MSDPGLHAALAELVAAYSASEIVEALAEACEEAQEERERTVGRVLPGDLYLSRAAASLSAAADNLVRSERERGDAIENALNVLEALDEPA